MTQPPSSRDPSVTVSALTLARGRAEHLYNLVRGLNAQTQPPAELVIAVMQPKPFTDLPATSFPVHQIHVPGDDLPLSAARNAVAAAASGDVLAFIDVDCIPAPSLIADYAAVTPPGKGLIMGEVMYLPDGAAAPGWTYAAFDAVAERHSDRAGPPKNPVAACEDYRCFWSLNFAMHREDWARSGGFDPAYRGYGGEDTDFGRTLAAREIDIWWARGAKVYHQYHPHCMPPIHHIPSILRNTEIFAAKWGHRTMGHWLHAFRMLGLIADRGDEIVILRDPDAADFALCRQDAHMPYANSARVIRALEARTAVAAE